MRSIQILGLICGLAALAVSYWAMFVITPLSSESAASSVGLVLMFVVVPLFGLSATLLMPSSLALLNAKLRRATFIFGKFWYSIWAINSFLSLAYLAIGLYLCYLYLVVGLVN